MSTDKLPDGWIRVKFGDVVRNVNENSRDLAADGLDRVVGLDHLDPGSLRLMRCDCLADLPDGTTFTRKFKPGQVLFGKRRAYQRKVAVPDFEGVCSGDILVFEPADKRMLAEFLPYVVQSDGFFDHAMGTSAGSLSPRTKWAELAKYEFALPPVDEQRGICEVLRQIDDVLALYVRAQVRSASLLGSFMNRLDSEEHPRRTLAEVCSSSITRGIDQPGPHVEGGVPYVRVSDMTGEPITLERLARASHEIARSFERSACQAGDVVYSIRASIGLTFVVPPDMEGVHLSRGTARLSPDYSVLVPGYLEACLQAPSLKRQAAKATRGSTFQQVSLESLRRFAIPLPPRCVQERFVSEHSAVQDLSSQLEATTLRISVARRQVLESLLRGEANDVQ